MRVLALPPAVMAVTVWWFPLHQFAQSLLLALVAVLALALGAAWKRLDRAHKAVVEARDLLRQIRDDAAAAPADSQRSES